MSDTFSVGVSEGSLSSREEIKVLLCYVFASFNFPIEGSSVISAIQSIEIANYFDLNDVLSELVKDKILEREKEKFKITELGRLISENLENKVPLSIRIKAVKTAHKFVENNRNEKENYVVIKKKSMAIMLNVMFPTGSKLLCQLICMCQT
jgi:hypothetical protein